jgi:hypothetical protein
VRPAVAVSWAATGRCGLVCLALMGCGDGTTPNRPIDASLSDGIASDARAPDDDGAADAIGDALSRDGDGRCFFNDQCLTAMCTPGGRAFGCGGCPPTKPCNSDPDCFDAEAGAIGVLVCEPGYCCHTSRQCIPPCQSLGCSTGWTCQASGHCNPTLCATNHDCPSTLSCSSGSCAPQPCSADVDCVTGGYCVNGTCADQPGGCAVGAP